jgi:hypothetical protein
VEYLEELVVRLVEACEDNYGSTPQRIVVEPNGRIEVNARVAYRQQTHPWVIHTRREDDD